jgi:hypothetical protein
VEKGATLPTAEAMPFSALIARAHPRFQVSRAVLFSGRVDGHGTVSNLSLNGCQIQSSCIVRPDTYLTLLLSLPDAPLKIRVAAVRWNRPAGFGVEFRYVEAAIRERLAQYLSTLSSLRSTISSLSIDRSQNEARPSHHHGPALLLWGRDPSNVSS